MWEIEILEARTERGSGRGCGDSVLRGWPLSCTMNQQLFHTIQLIAIIFCFISFQASSISTGDVLYVPGRENSSEHTSRSESQCFWWTLNHSIARDDFEYPIISDGSRGHAKKGRESVDDVGVDEDL
jgi:hypothetical protein